MKMLFVIIILPRREHMDRDRVGSGGGLCFRVDDAGPLTPVELKGRRIEETTEPRQRAPAITKCGPVG
jgi:hypothetical protein